MANQGRSSRMPVVRTGRTCPVQPRLDAVFSSKSSKKDSCTVVPGFHQTKSLCREKVVGSASRLWQRSWLSTRHVCLILHHPVALRVNRLYACSSPSGFACSAPHGGRCRLVGSSVRWHV